MHGGGELPAVCAGAVIDAASATPPALIGGFDSDAVDSGKWPSGQQVEQVEPEEPDFLIYYCYFCHFRTPLNVIFIQVTYDNFKRRLCTF